MHIHHPAGEPTPDHLTYRLWGMGCTVGGHLHWHFLECRWPLDVEEGLSGGPLLAAPPPRVRTSDIQVVDPEVG